MAARAHLRVGVEVVEQNEVARQRMNVRRDLLREQAERAIAVALRQIAQHLVVRAVFLDDVNDMADRRRAAHRPGDRVVLVHRRPAAGAGRQRWAVLVHAASARLRPAGLGRSTIPSEPRKSPPM